MRDLFGFAMSIWIGVLRRHPPIHQGTGTPGSAEVFYSGRMRMMTLPPRHFD
jgi:hypothetical protein